MIRNNKVISALLSMTIVSGMVTPAYATEGVIDASADQTFSLENAELEKVSDDTDILDESLSDAVETEDNNTVIDENINNNEVKNEIVDSEELTNGEEADEEINTSEGKNENSNAPLYSIDEEMENYLKEYLQSLNTGMPEENLEKALQEYLEKMSSENEDVNNLEDGIYTIDNKVIKMNSLDESILRGYLSEESLLEIKDGKISAILTFDKNVTTLDEYKILINNKNVKFKTLESNDSVLKIKFNIDELTESIVLKTNINNEYYSKDEECRILLDITSIEKNEEELIEEDNDENIEDGMYLLSNSTFKFNENKESVLRNYLSNESVLEVKNGQKYLTLIFNKDVSAIKDFHIYINNYISNYNVIESNDEILKVRFQIESLDDEIVIDANIVNEFYNENFKTTVVLDSDSLQKKSDEVYEESTITDISLDEEIMPMIEEAAKSTGYDLIVTENSENKLSKSKLIVKEGKMIAELTFTEASDLGNVKEIKVNGHKELNNTVKENKDTNTVVIEVPINSFNDVINIVFSNSINNDGWNETTLKNVEIKDIRLSAGIYDLDITSNGKKHISSTQLEINNNGKMYLVTKFGMGSLITVTNLHVNGKAQSYSTKLTGQGFASTLTVKTEINSLDDVVNIFVDINLSAMGMGIMSHDMEVKDLRLKGVSLPQDDTENQEPEDEEEDSSTSSEVLEDGQYVIGTKILKTGTQEESMAKGYFKEKSDLLVKEGKYNLTLYANNLSMMSNIVVKVNGDEVKTNIQKNNDGTGTISFDIDRLNSNIIMYCHVDGYGHVADYDFSIGLDKNNITDSNGQKVDPPSEYEEVQLSNSTTYKINNKIRSGTGSESALAKYVDETSIIEVDSTGNIYLTLNFTMSGLMNGRTITLNNNSSVTTYAVVNSNDTNGIRFKISSLKDKIHISNQYGSSVNDGFTLSLIQDTLTETGKYSEGSSSSGSTSGDSSSSDDDDDDIEDGTYVIKNYCYKEKSDTTSDARGYLDTESVLVVKNGKKHVILKFTHGKMMSNTSIKVGDAKTSYTVVKNSGNKYYIKFKIDSLSDEIMVTSTIDTGVPAIGVMEGVKFRVLLRESTLKEDDDAADFDDDDDEIEEDEETTEEDTTVEEELNKDESVVAPPNNGTIGNQTGTEQYKKLTYKVNNEIVTDSKIGYQAARGAVNQTSYYEIENEKKYITLGFSQTDILNNIRISDNGKDISYSIVSEDKKNNTMNIKFEIPSISTQLTVTANVTAMGRDISFGLKFLETTLELISTEEYENLSTDTSGNGGSASSGVISGLSSSISNLFSGGSSSEGGIEATEESVENLADLANEYFKKYTINNEVVSDNAIGRTMARKYLSETSIIEEIDGQFYATITFSSASSMGNFRIEVNGETVSHTVPLKDMGNDLISLRFPISSVNDDIRTYIFISPMKMTIDFGIKFLEDTMVLIEEGTVGDDENAESSSLADTLTNLNQAAQSNKSQVSTIKLAVSTSAMVIVLNQGIAGLASLFKRFKNKSLLNKIIDKE